MKNNKHSEISELFGKLQVKYNDADLMIDGILDDSSYEKSKVKILWILKQDFYDSGALESTYATRIRDNIQGGGVDGSSTWRRMSLVTHALISGEREFDKIKGNEKRANSLLETAIIEVNKELGDSKSPDSVIQEGFEKYQELINLQIDAYEPDVIIICLPEKLKNIVCSIYSHCHKSSFDDFRSNIIVNGSDVGFSKVNDPLFIWAYHPQATTGCHGLGIRDQDYTESITQAYDSVIAHNNKTK